MRSSTLTFFLLNGLLLAQAAPRSESAPSVEQKTALERRYVNFWDNHEHEVSKGRGKGWDKGAKKDKDEYDDWWEWPKKGKKKSQPKPKPKPKWKPKQTKKPKPTPIPAPPIVPIEITSSTTSTTSTTSIPTTQPTTSTTSTTSTASTTTTNSINSVSTTTTTSTKPTTTPSTYILPPYPAGITDPVQPGSYLEKLVPTISTYYNRTREVFPSCHMFGNPEEFRQGSLAPYQRSPCVPTCEDVYSHTHEALYINCEYTELCTYATYVLPDSECPGRINSYQLRCPQSFDEVAVKKVRTGAITPGLSEEQIAEMQAGTHITPDQCREKGMEEIPQQRRALSLASRRRRSTKSLSVRSTETSLTVYSPSQLQKRRYVYRNYLNSLNAHRTIMVTGPPLPGCAGMNADGGYMYCPFNCVDITWSVVIETFKWRSMTRTHSLSNFELCRYAEEQKNDADERCPGVGTPDTLCPLNFEELVQVCAEESEVSEDVARAALKEEFEDIKDMPCEGTYGKDWFEDSGCFEGGFA